MQVKDAVATYTKVCQRQIQPSLSLRLIRGNAVTSCRVAPACVMCAGDAQCVPAQHRVRCVHIVSSWQPDRRLQDMLGMMTSDYTVNVYLQGLGQC